MKCFYHHDRDAVGVCHSCNRGVCSDCAAEVAGCLACQGRCEEDVRSLRILISHNTRLVGAQLQARAEAAEYAEQGKQDGPVQWRLSTMFLITTVLAIALAGFGQLGLEGAAGTLFSSWLGLIGVYCLYGGITDRKEGWPVNVLMGTLLTGLAVYLFLSVMFADAANRW